LKLRGFYFPSRDFAHGYIAVGEDATLAALEDKLATGSLAAPMRRRATVPNCGVASLLYQQSGPVGYKLKNRKIAPFKNKILQFRIKYRLCQCSEGVMAFWPWRPCGYPIAFLDL